MPPPNLRARREAHPGPERTLASPGVLALRVAAEMPAMKLTMKELEELRELFDASIAQDWHPRGIFAIDTPKALDQIGGLLEMAEELARLHAGHQRPPGLPILNRAGSVTVLYLKPGKYNANGTPIAWRHTFDSIDAARENLERMKREDPEGWAEVEIGALAREGEK
jgi:hypothetical protein